MGLFDILLIGVGLSMDAAAVTIANVLGDAGIPRRKVFAMAGAFGLFQGLMPVFGFFAGSLFADFISRYAGFVTLIVLGVIGISMIKESFSHKEESEAPKALTPKILLVQAIATSIDAFAVGVSFALPARIFLPLHRLLPLPPFSLACLRQSWQSGSATCWANVLRLSAV